MPPNSREPVDRTDEDAVYHQLDRSLTDLDELLRLTVRATKGTAVRVETYGSLARLVDAVLPGDAAAESRIARALHLDVDTLRQFRRREIDPAELPPEALSTLGRCALLTWETFDALVARDLAWFAEESPLAMLRDNTADPKEVRRALRAAWDRDALDDPDWIGRE